MEFGTLPISEQQKNQVHFVLTFTGFLMGMFKQKHLFDDLHFVYECHCIN